VTNLRKSGIYCDGDNDNKNEMKGAVLILQTCNGGKRYIVPVSIPLYPFSVASDVRHEIFLHFVGRPSCDLQNDLAQGRRTQNVDVVCSVTSTARKTRDGVVRKLGLEKMIVSIYDHSDGFSVVTVPPQL
jgi:hypothetical protein